MRECTICGAMHNRNADTCQACYIYLRKHPEGNYDIPPKGTMMYATNGDPICHVCGRAYRTLDGHINQVHDMSHKQYCDRYKLLRNTKLCSEEYRQMKRTLQIPYKDVVVYDNLVVKGEATRFKPGQYIPLRGHHIKKGGE